MSQWSGDAMQDWLTFLRSQSQAGLVHIVEQRNSSDADLETKIVTGGFSYPSNSGIISL